MPGIMKYKPRSVTSSNTICVPAEFDIYASVFCLRLDYGYLRLVHTGCAFLLISLLFIRAS